MQAAAPAFGRAAALAGRRSVATFAIMRAPEAMLQDLWGGSRDDAQPAASDGPRSQVRRVRVPLLAPACMRACVVHLLVGALTKPCPPPTCMHPQRAATAAIARRQQWQTVPMHDCPKTLPAAMQEPCAEVGAFCVLWCWVGAGASLTARGAMHAQQPRRERAPPVSC